MKNIFCYLSLLLLFGCAATASSSKKIDDGSSVSGCTDKPLVALKQENIKKVVLHNKLINESGSVSDKENKGYIFEAEAGQKLSYKTNSDICVWVYAPDNELVNGTKLEKTGTYTIQLAAPRGSTTFDLEISLDSQTNSSLTKSNSTESFDRSNSSSEENADSSTNSDNSTTVASEQSDFTQEQALEIVKGWYEAKPEIFGGSFDRSLVDKYTTGQLYYETLQKDGGGSIGWLQRNGCYYIYSFSNIDNVLSFSTSGTRPVLTVKVSERLQLNGPSSAGCSNRQKSYSKNVSYWFERENGIWKIYAYEVE